MYIIFFCIWVFYFSIFQRWYDINRARNYVSFYHSLLCVMNIYLHPDAYYIITSISLGYFIYDTCYILLNCYQKEKLYIYHHLVMIIFLKELQETHSSLLLKILYIGELSNFFTYIVYDLIKKNATEDIILILKYIQFIWFVNFRIVYSSCLLFTNYEKLFTYYSCFPILSLYCIGYIWMFKQSKLLKLW